MSPKRRLSASVDADLVRAARAAARHGNAPTVSAWVNDALRLKVEHDRRLAALADFIAAHEAEHGVITAEEIERAARRARGRAAAVRSLGTESGPRRPRRRDRPTPSMQPSCSSPPTETSS